MEKILSKYMTKCMGIKDLTEIDIKQQNMIEKYNEVYIITRKQAF